MPKPADRASGIGPSVMLELAGLRALPEDARAQTTASAGRTVLALVCVEPGTSVSLEAAPDPSTGDLNCTLSVAAPDAQTAAELAAALRAALLPIIEFTASSYTAHPLEGSPSDARRWWLQPPTATVAPMGVAAPPPRAHALDTWRSSWNSRTLWPTRQPIPKRHGAVLALPPRG